MFVMATASDCCHAARLQRCVRVEMQVLAKNAGCHVMQRELAYNTLCQPNVVE